MYTVLYLWDALSVVVDHMHTHLLRVGYLHFLRQWSLLGETAHCRKPTKWCLSGQSPHHRLHVHAYNVSCGSVSFQSRNCALNLHMLASMYGHAGANVPLQLPLHLSSAPGLIIALGEDKSCCSLQERQCTVYVLTFAGLNVCAS